MHNWYNFFKELNTKDYFVRLNHFLHDEYQKYTIYPSREHVFYAFRLTPYQNVKAVIIGQDPYHEPNQAMGLAFSVPWGVKLPPSLLNIYKEMELEFNMTMDRNNGDLSYLAGQGVLLLNAYLTVRKGEPLSHKCKEYEQLLVDTIKYINEKEEPVVFMLWGGFARKLKKYITNKRHLVLEAAHPSPLSANRGGWFGCDHFKKTSEFLDKNHISPIFWRNY